jgi:hypothetical protein
VRRILAAGAIAAALVVATVGARAQTPPDIDTLLARVSERLTQYYKRAQSLVCTEKSIVQPLSGDFAQRGLPRTIESELRIEPDLANGDDETALAASFVREILKINGKPPREKDKRDRSRCTDPNPLTTEPLAFLLPANRKGYRFSVAGYGKGKDRESLIIEFVTPREEGDGKIVENSRGIEDCFSVSIPTATRGRVWVDAKTYEVTRMESHLAGLGDVKSTFDQQRKHNLPSFMTIERYDTAIRYRSVRFSDPEEALLLPESIETVAIWRNGLESTRRRQEYSGYRRFLTAGRIVK